MTQPEGRGATQPELARAYVPAEFEHDVYERWLAADVFAPDGAGSTADPSLPPFVIIQPPPNVTGSLHLGHAQRTTVEDLMVRHARMVGHPALFLPGLDHASIAAQFVLDGILAKEGESRAQPRARALPRADARPSSPRPARSSSTQQRRLGGSCDWGRLRYTMDEVSAKAVRVAFERLYRDGLAYRTEALVNWCPGCRTSVSDLEVIPTPETGTLWRCATTSSTRATGEPDPGATITVATTTPRDDPRRHRRRRPSRRPALRGARRPARPDPVRRARRPDHRGRRRRPGVRHRRGEDHARPRPRRPRDGQAPRPRDARRSSTTRRASRARAREFDGLDRYEARAGDPRRPSRRSGDLAGEQAHEMVIGRCQRSDDVVEPRLKTQWFVRTEPLADAALEATRGGRDDDPAAERFEKTWEHWMTNIRDWNVSRQLWWGHRIPAWYCPDGHVTVTSTPDGPAACEVCASTGVASSSRTPTSSTPGSAPACGRSRRSAGPTPTDDFRRYYPGTVMETGYDILFFWVARMMMLGLHLTDAPPFRDRLPVGPDPRPVRPEDVEDEGQHRRPAGHDRRGRRRRAAVRARPRHDAGQRPAVRAGQGRERPELRQQAVERDPIRARRPARDDPRRRGTAPPGRGPPRAGRPLGAVACRRHRRGRGPRDGRLQLRRGHAAPVRRHLERVLRLGPRARQGAPRGRRPTPGASARPPGGRWWRRSTRTCACSIR